MVRFLEAIGPGAHMMAVCQPCVAALAATAVMAEDDNPAQPRSLTLMAGPVDCRVNPTSVNLLATSKPIDWFEKNLISHVPLPHAGFMRRVYPGFVQLSAFMSMNPERHKNAFKEMYHHLVDGDVEKANIIRVFYDEYLAVNDLPAEFYLETVEKVFQTYDLARGALRYRGRTVDTAAIRRTALMTVEGERDDICSVGQTVAAQDLCPNVRPYLQDPPHPDRRGPLRRVQRQEVEPADLSAGAGRAWRSSIMRRTSSISVSVVQVSGWSSIDERTCVEPSVPPFFTMDWMTSRKVSMPTSSPCSMTTSEPMSFSAMMSTARASGSSGVTVKRVLPLTRRMPLTFM
jgi:hypothetical protein